ncbi:MAG: CrcB family protein [Microbacterium sp.]|nr:CrcB family protein [Microbacterium sp.]
MTDAEPEGELPLDPDIEVEEVAGVAARPLHLRWTAIGLVVAGGAIGTFARYAIAQAIPAWGGIPVAIFAVNVAGAFLLGWLLEALVRRGEDHGGRRAIRLFAGTGVLGGFTTYSTFALDTDGLLQAAEVGGSVLYALTTVVVGAAASVAGIALGAALHRSRARRV